MGETMMTSPYLRRRPRSLDEVRAERERTSGEMSHQQETGDHGERRETMKDAQNA
ncbi:MAG: hypothetical protein Tsb008_17560 [Rhodothalassiaceae bacterium]